MEKERKEKLKNRGSSKLNVNFKMFKSKSEEYRGNKFFVLGKNPQLSLVLQT